MQGRFPGRRMSPLHAFRSRKPTPHPGHRRRSDGPMMRRYWIPVLLDDGGRRARRNARCASGARRAARRLSRYRRAQVGVIDGALPAPARLARARDATKKAACAASITAGSSTSPGAASRCRPNPRTQLQRPHAHRSYPVREAGGMVWTYLGPPESEPPPFPAYDWMELPREQRAIVKVGERTNYLQAARRRDRFGALVVSAPRRCLRDWKKRLRDLDRYVAAPRGRGHAYGFRYAAIRQAGRATPTSEQYVRVTLFVVPFTAFIPRPLETHQNAHVQIFVPIDDTHTMFYGVFFSQDGAPVDEAGEAAQHHVVPGVDLDAQLVSGRASTKQLVEPGPRRR